MPAISINQTVETAVKTMLNKHASDCVALLADKYNFDLQEALALLDLDKVMPTKDKARAADNVKKTKKEKSSNEKKARKPSGYQAFMKEKREEVKAELSTKSMDELKHELNLDEEPEKFNAGKHVLSALGMRWKKLSQSEQEHYNDMASSEEDS